MKKIAAISIVPIVLCAGLYADTVDTVKPVTTDPVPLYILPGDIEQVYSLTSGISIAVTNNSGALTAAGVWGHDKCPSTQFADGRVLLACGDTVLASKINGDANQFSYQNGSGGCTGCVGTGVANTKNLGIDTMTLFGANPDFHLCAAIPNARASLDAGVTPSSISYANCPVNTYITDAAHDGITIPKAAFTGSMTGLTAGESTLGGFSPTGVFVVGTTLYGIYTVQNAPTTGTTNGICGITNCYTESVLWKATVGTASINATTPPAITRLGTFSSLATTPPVGSLTITGGAAVRNSGTIFPSTILNSSLWDGIMINKIVYQAASFTDGTHITVASPPADGTYDYTVLPSGANSAGHMMYVSPELVTNAQLTAMGINSSTYLPGSLPGGDVVFFFSGNYCVRCSNVYLGVMAASNLATLGAGFTYTNGVPGMYYLSGFAAGLPVWSTTETNMQPLLTSWSHTGGVGTNQAYGEGSVRYHPLLNRFVMMYGSPQTGGLYMRTSLWPWVWSGETVVQANNSAADQSVIHHAANLSNNFNQFLITGNTLYDPVDSPALVPINTENFTPYNAAGSVYGAYQMPASTDFDSGNGTISVFYDFQGFNKYASWMGTVQLSKAPTTRTICASGCQYTPTQIQQAVNDAAPGDIITIDPSTPATTPIGLSLPVKANPNNWYITTRTSKIYNLPGDVRVAPADANLAIMTVTSIDSPVVLTTLSGGIGSSYYRFEGIQFQGISGDTTVTAMMQMFNQCGGTSCDNEVAKLAHHLVFDRCVFAGYPSFPGPRNAFSVNTGAFTLRNSYFYEIKYDGTEAHDIAEWGGTGPFYFRNNHFEASTEETLFGGANPNIMGVRPNGLTFLGNEYFKPWTWRFSSAAAAPTGACQWDSRGGEWYADSSTGGLIYTCNSSFAWVTTTQAAMRAALYLVNFTTGTINPTGACTTGGQTYENTSAVTYFMCVGSAWTSVTIGPWANATMNPSSGSFRWEQKNHWELKNAERALVEGNYLHQSWGPADAGQHGACFLINQVDNSYAVGHGDASSGIFWVNIQYNHCDFAPWVASSGIIPVTFYNHPPYDISIHDNLATNIGTTEFSGPDVTLDQIGAESRQTFSYNTIISNPTTTTEEAVQLLALTGGLGGAPQPPGYGEETNFVGNIMGWDWQGLRDDTDSHGFLQDAIAFNWGENRQLGRNVIINNMGVATSEITSNLFTISSIDSQVGCRECANPAPTAYTGIGFTNYAGGDYHMSSGTYSGAWAYGRPAGANIDQVNWSTAHALDGQPAPFLDFIVRGVVLGTTTASLNYTAYDTNTCTTTVSLLQDFSSPVFTGTDSGGDPDRTEPITGLTTKTRYYYKLACGSGGSFNRVGKFLTN